MYVPARASAKTGVTIWRLGALLQNSLSQNKQVSTFRQLFSTKMSSVVEWQSSCPCGLIWHPRITVLPRRPKKLNKNIKLNQCSFWSDGLKNDLQFLFTYLANHLLAHKFWLFSIIGIVGVKVKKCLIQLFSNRASLLKDNLWNKVWQKCDQKSDENNSNKLCNTKNPKCNACVKSEKKLKYMKNYQWEKIITRWPFN